MSEKEITRRDFLSLTAGAVGAIGAGSAFLTLGKTMTPAKDVLALSTVEVKLDGISEGKTKTVMWRGKPIFIRHRTENEVKAVRSVPIKTLIDTEKAADEERTKKPEWLVVVGVCTHLGCVPNQVKGTGMKDAENAEGGWHCPCHGSFYDASGRVIVGPAPRNLDVPPYEFTSPKTLLIG
jgi:ubiquinol-cytochrome c reductase iron-sulfur subunit